MAKNRIKKKNRSGAGVVSMDTSEPTASYFPQAMDMSESGAQKPVPAGLSRKMKGRPMKRSKNVRKMKAIAKAISSNEKAVEKALKSDNKTTRTQSAKLLGEYASPVDDIRLLVFNFARNYEHWLKQQNS